MRYSEDIYREEAVKFMRGNKDRAFFLYYATPLVHGPLVAKELGAFKDRPAPWTQRHKLWAAMVTELDRSVGIIVDEVKQLGLERNTIILFASDNGYAQWGYFGRQAWADDPLFKNKGPWNRGKHINSLGGVIVPFIAWAPGRMPAGSKTDRAINFCDFMATAGELAGTKLPGPTDGVSFVPLLEGRDKDQPIHPAMIWPSTCAHMQMPDDWAPEKDKTTYHPAAALLDEKWYALGLGKTVRLFDITTDPGLKHDLSGKRPDLRARAAAEFEKLNRNMKHQP
jgi:arylsulfatase A-like enzyme